VAFDASFARDVVLPLAKAAYAVMDGSQPDLPSGFAQTTLIQADAAVLAAKTTPHPAVAAMTKNTNIFGLMGRSTARRTAFVSFRGTSDAPDWLADLDAIPAAYSRLPNFGQVHTGFQDVYDLVRASIAANLATATAGCDQILITGHSLGAALAVLAAPDVFRNMPPNKIEPRLITFAGPRVGLSDFVESFNADIESCFRVVNFLDIVPLVPPAPYVHVGAEIP
jgi:predicted lipase